MKKVDYFDLFIKAAAICDRGAASLSELIEHPSETRIRTSAIHEIEHEGDELFHILNYHLKRAFITPIEREDILSIARAIEDTIDAIDEASMVIDIMNIKSIRQPVKELVELIVEACAALSDAMKEFKDFKKSKELKRLIVEINHIEEEGDKIYQNGMRKLFSSEAEVLEVVRWQNILNALENVLDKCEDAADIMEGVIINNS